MSVREFYQGSYLQNGKMEKKLAQKNRKTNNFTTLDRTYLKVVYPKAKLESY